MGPDVGRAFLRARFERVGRRLGAGRAVLIARTLASVVFLLMIGVFSAAPAGAHQASTSASTSVAPSSFSLSSPDSRSAGQEIAELRTRTSRSYRDAAGTVSTRVYARSMNYKDAGGDWQPIDNTLVAVGEVLRNKANSYEVELPDQIAGNAVKVTEGEAWVSLAPQGAGAAARRVGGVASYEDAWPGVDLSYAVQADAVKETLVLGDAAASQTFAFALRLSAGLRPRLADSGAVDVSDADGKSVFSLSPPTMIDAAGEAAAVAAALEPSGDGWLLSLSPSSKWLAAPERKFPVTIDPSVYPGASPDCLVSNESGLANTNFCSWNFLEAGYGYAPGSHDHNALMKFDVQAAVPAGSDVISAQLWANVTGEVGTATKDIYAHRITSAWNSDVSWNKRDGANAWTTPGGDVAAAETDVPVNGSTSPGWYAWQIPDMVEGWSKGTVANNGVLLKDDGTHTALGTMLMDSSETANGPYLEIRYDRRIGERRGFAFERFQLSDRISLAVNPGSGNLLVRERDLTVPGGTGPDLQLSRSMNSMTPDWNAFGAGRTWDTGDDLIMRWTVAEAQFFGPSGFVAAFKQAGGSGIYTAPPGFDAKLTFSGGEFTLTDNASQAKTVFGAAGRVKSQEDRNGRKISYTYLPGNMQVDKITDSQGRETVVTHNANNHITKIVDSAGREYLYTYTLVGGQTRLTSYTDPKGGVTAYGYDSDRRLAQITTPAGRVTKITYWGTGDARDGRVKTITRVTNVPLGTGLTTDFNYSSIARDGSSTATVTDPKAHATQYEFDTSGRPKKITDALGRNRKITYTTNSDVQDYTEPNNTGSTPNTRLTYDGNGNQSDSATRTSDTTPGDDLKTHADYGPTWTGGTIAGAAYLPKLFQDEQDKASGTSGRGTAIEYDNAQGNPTKFAKGTTSSAQLSYRTGTDGKPGELATSKDGNSNQTTYNYDSHGNLTQIVPPAITGGGTLLGTTSLDYSGAAGDDLALSRITRVIDGRGNRAEYVYDDLDRITKLTYKSSAGVEESRFEYVYDGDGNLTQRKDFLATTKTYDFTYDALNRVTQELLPGSVTNLYSYDAASNLATVQDASGTTTYTYDEINRQKTIQEPGAASAIAYTYLDTVPDADPLTADYGQKNTITLPNNIATVNYLDRAGRLLRTESKNGATVAQRFLYEYKLGANQQQLVSRETDMASVNVDYLYDPLDRLLTATNSSTTDDFAYVYDPASNILTKTKSTGTPDTYRYNQANQLCWRKTALYNPYSTAPACGSPPAGATTYTYDADGDQLTGSETATYNRAMQTTAWGATNFAYAGAGQAQRTAVGATSVINNLLGVGSYANGATVDYFTRDENKAFISQRRPSASAPNRRTYPLTDRLGSTRTLTDETGATVRRYNYEPYGSDIAVAGTWTTTTPLKFAGGERDATALYHFGQRYYNPVTGRWTQQDPLNQASDMQQANRYTYAGDDPVNSSDPDGLYRRNDGSWSPCLRGNRYGCARGLGYPRVRRSYYTICKAAELAVIASPTGRAVTWIGKAVSVVSFVKC